MTTTYPNKRRPKSPDARAQQFLSRGFEELVASENLHFDLIIIGSGYGGSVAAAQFAGTRRNGKPLRVCVLERGQERLPGSFPDRFALLAPEVVVQPMRSPNDLAIDLVDSQAAYETNPSHSIGNRDGLYSIHAGSEIAAVTGNGLGGGSLINAGVMLQPKQDVFESRAWPAALRVSSVTPNSGFSDDDWRKASQMLGAQVRSTTDPKEKSNTVERAGVELDKHAALRSIAQDPKTFSSVPITVRLQDQDFSQAVHTNACINCGDCATGCNFGAKKSLDTNLLAQAAIDGVEIYTGATVQRFDQIADDDSYSVHVWYTNATVRARMSAPVTLTASHLIIAAGTFASTELLFRSQAMSAGRLRFSDQLGTRFSGNGDSIAAVVDQALSTKTVSTEDQPADTRQVGPTITGMIDLRSEPGQAPIAIQEMSVPAPLFRAFRSAITYSRAVDGLSNPSLAKASSVDRALRWNANDQGQTSIVAIMGMDPRQGTFTFRRDPSSGSEHFGLTWNKFDVNGRPFQTADEGTQFYTDQIRRLNELVRSPNSTTRVFANPVTNPLGVNGLGDLMEVAGGPQVTVHPLGGCPMGDSVNSGVVDDIGRVFQANDSAKTADVYNRLAVLDGSIMPTPVGINPALTISAIALRACARLKTSEHWGIDDQAGSTEADNSGKPGLKRPEFRAHDNSDASRSNAVSAEKREVRKTEIQIAERLVGDAILLNGDVEVAVKVELTLLTDPAPVPEISTQEGAKLTLKKMTPQDSALDLPLTSRIRFFDKNEWDQWFDPATSLQVREKEQEESARNGAPRTAQDWLSGRQELNYDLEKFLSDRALVEASVVGHIKLPRERWRGHGSRVTLGLFAWLANRGISDMVISGFTKGLERVSRNARRWLRSEYKVADEIAAKEKGFGGWIGKAVPLYFTMFANAGRMRVMEYELKVDYIVDKLPAANKISPEHYERVAAVHGVITKGLAIRGRKKLHYVSARSILIKWIPGLANAKKWAGKKTERANPWAQLMYIHLDNIPKVLRQKSVLKLDTAYFARARLPLFRFHSADNVLDAYADLGLFLLDILRPSALQHFFSFRAPVIHRPEIVRRLENRAKWVPKNDGLWLSTPFQLDEDEYLVDGLIAKTRPLQVLTTAHSRENNVPMFAALTKYVSEAKWVRDQGARRNPVLLIHGFSASGTTFAHNALKPGLAKHLCEQGFDVWVLDMRSSCRAPSSRYAWKFEDMAYHDIPTALNLIYQESNPDSDSSVPGETKRTVNVVAHCMGAAMLSMALLKSEKTLTLMGLSLSRLGLNRGRCQGRSRPIGW